MISGHIDFDSLRSDTTLSVAGAGGERTISLRGFRLEYSCDAEVFVNKRELLLLVGRPRIRDADLTNQVRQHGWQSCIEKLCKAPDNILGALAGRFALLWLDLAGRRIGFASDRFNTYSFCYTHEGNRLSFADRADGVAVRERQIEPQSVFDYLYFHTIPAPATIFRGVHRLEPGTRLTADREGAQLIAWWQPQFDEAGEGTFSASADKFMTLIRQAVDRELDGRAVGAFLSGGTDSSTVVGMLSRSGSPVTAYSIGFDAEGYDEMAYAQAAARHFGVEHRPYYITPNDLVAHIPAVAASYDQPFGNSSVLPAFLCARRAREDGFDKLFAGDGGDELFGGNSRYAKQRMFDYYRHVPGVLRQRVLEPLLMQSPVRHLPLARKAASYVEQARTPLPDRTAGYNLLHRLGMENVFQPDFLATVDTGAPLELQRAVWNGVRAHALINRMLGFDWRFTLADNDLPKVLGSARLAGIGAVFPLLDDDLVDFSLALPPEYKLKGLKLRWFFKEALRGFLPPEILAKKKQGFGLPFGHWMLKHRPLEQLARESVSPLIALDVIRADFVDDLFSVRLPAFPGYYGEMVWIMMMMGQWLESHLSSRVIADLPAQAVS